MMFRGFKVKECSTGLCLISGNVVAYCLTHPLSPLLSPSLLTAWLSGLLITEGAALEAGAREGVCACVCVRERESV